MIKTQDINRSIIPSHFLLNEWPLHASFAYKIIKYDIRTINDDVLKKEYERVINTKDRKK